MLSEDFKQFCKDRVRSVAQGYPQVTGVRVTFKEINKAYNRWSVLAGKKKVASQDLEKLCEETFGDSRGKREYVNLRVFLDEEDLEEFDKEIHQEEVETKNTLHLPTSDVKVVTIKTFTTEEQLEQMTQRVFDLEIESMKKDENIKRLETLITYILKQKWEEETEKTKKIIKALRAVEAILYQ